MTVVAVVDAVSVAVQRLGYAAEKPEQLQVVSAWHCVWERGLCSFAQFFIRNFLPDGDHMLRGTGI